MKMKDSHDPQENLAFMANPEEWPQWTLPLKRVRETESRVEMDFAWLEETEDPGVFRFQGQGPSQEEIELVGDSKMLQALVDAGWRVD